MTIDATSEIARQKLVWKWSNRFLYVYISKLSSLGIGKHVENWVEIAALDKISNLGDIVIDKIRNTRQPGSNVRFLHVLMS